MHELVARSLGYVARLTDQHTARANAAEGSAILRRRRDEQDDVDEYLRAER